MMWLPEWYEAFARSPFGWLQVLALVMIVAGVAGLLEQRDARREASKASHPSNRRVVYDWSRDEGGPR